MSTYVTVAVILPEPEAMEPPAPVALAVDRTESAPEEETADAPEPAELRALAQ